VDANASAASNNAATVAAAFYAAGETITIFAGRLVNWGGCVTVFCRVGRRSREPTPTRGRWNARDSRLQDRCGGDHNDRQARTNLLVRVTCHRRTMPTQQKSLEGLAIGFGGRPEGGDRSRTYRPIQVWRLQAG